MKHEIQGLLVLSCTISGSRARNIRVALTILAVQFNVLDLEVPFGDSSSEPEPREAGQKGSRDDTQRVKDGTGKTLQNKYQKAGNAKFGSYSGIRRHLGKK